MKVIVCVDDNGGMLFNRRRQSQDKTLTEDVIKNNGKIWINSFSSKLFSEYVGQVIIDDEFLNKAGKGDCCFVENQLLKPYEDRIEQLVVYKWNRKYPSDFKLDLNIDNWKLKEQAEFEGNSHEKITREIYSK